MTGTENREQQAQRWKNGRAEYARLITERATKQAIKDGRVFISAMSETPIPAPKKNPQPKPWSRTAKSCEPPMMRVYTPPTVASETVQAIKEVGTKAAKGWRSAVRKVTDAWTRKKGKEAA